MGHPKMADQQYNASRSMVLATSLCAHWLCFASSLSPTNNQDVVKSLLSLKLNLCVRQLGRRKARLQGRGRDWAQPLMAPSRYHAAKSGRDATDQTCVLHRLRERDKGRGGGRDKKVTKDKIQIFPDTGLPCMSHNCSGKGSHVRKVWSKYTVDDGRPARPRCHRFKTDWAQSGRNRPARVRLDSPLGYRNFPRRWPVYTSSCELSRALRCLEAHRRIPVDCFIVKYCGMPLQQQKDWLASQQTASLLERKCASLPGPMTSVPA